LATEFPDLRAGAAWHVHDIDVAQGRVRLLRLSESDYRETSFLDQRVEPMASARAEAGLQQVRAALLPPGATATSPYFIFHLGHCGSTLLSRALSASPNLLPLREPLTLRMLAANPEQREHLPLALAALSRVFNPGQLAVVKATSTCNNLIEPILLYSTGTRAILMYVPLETYLAGMLGKLSPPSDLHGQAGQRLADWQTLSGAPELDLAELNEAQLAVVSWLTGMRCLLAASARYADRTLLLDFEAFLDAPEASLERIAGFLGRGGDLPAMLAAWPDIATGYSKKPDEPYSAFNRLRTLQRGRMTRGEEIRQGLDWAGRWIAQLPELAACVHYLGQYPG